MKESGVKVLSSSARAAGRIERVRFSSPEGLLIAILDDGTTFKGFLPGINRGDQIEIEGRMVRHPKYGPQLEVLAFNISDDDPDPDKLLLAESHRFIFQTLGLKRRGEKILNFYGPRAKEVILENPYRIAQEVPGIGFKTVDADIADKIGIDADDPRRHDECVLHCLREAASQGHTYLPASVLTRKAMAFMDMEVPQQVHKAIGRLLNPERRKDGTISNPRLVMEEVKGEKLLYHHELWASEKGCAEHVERILGNQQRSPADQVEIPEIEVDDKKISLTKEQRLAVKMAFEENLLVITGGPGTGKTTIVRAITQIARRKGLEVYLCSPTGRAAQRLAEAAGCEAFTIHRLLAYSPGRGVFQRNSQSPLGSYFGPSILICDESSMLDVELAFSLLDAVPGDMRVVLVGDADQLPPVGPGCFFRDLISSGKVEVVRLGQIFRQEQTGGLIQVAARDMLERKIPTFGTDSKTHDLFRFTFGSESRAQEIVVDLVSKKVPEKFGIPSDRIQVLTPVKRGSLGTRDLNLRLQYALRGMNPTDGKFLVGDRVIVMENDYDHMLMNGDIGQVVALYQKGPVVNFGGTEYKLGNTDVQKMELGYAVTIHKSQGSEYDATICVLTSNGMKGFLSRNMLYTALTRGKRLVILVSPGDDTLFNEALNTDDSRRYTRFVDRLLGEEANSSSAEK